MSNTAVTFKSVRDSLILSMLNKAGTRIVREFKSRRVWTITIGAEDPLYYDVHEWLMSQEHADSPRRSLAVKTKSYYDEMAMRKYDLRIVFDGEYANKIKVNGHEVSISIRDKDNPTLSDNEMSRVVKPPKLFFTAKTRAGRDAVVAVINQIHNDKHAKTRKPKLNVLGKWNEWTVRSDVPSRSMESVIVKGNVVDALLADLEDFRGREEEYVRRGIPYHRAYLLTGPPGTGKTSSVKAVAGALGMDLWYAQLSEIGKDAKLVETLTQVGMGSILLLEDIDSFGAAVSRTTDGAKEVTNSGLLNALDGVATPHGLVTIMTTNHPDNLDEALIRPGRIDRIFAFENPDSATIHRHFEFFYGHPAEYQGEWPEGMSSAEVSEIFKSNMDDSHAAEIELLKKG